MGELRQEQQREPAQTVEPEPTKKLEISIRKLEKLETTYVRNGTG